MVCVFLKLILFMLRISNQLYLYIIFPQPPNLTDLLVCTLHKFSYVLMQVSSAGLNHLSGFKAWLLKLENFFEAFTECKCLFIIN